MFSGRLCRRVAGEEQPRGRFVPELGSWGSISPSESELEEWAHTVRDWSREREVFAYFNNDWEGFAPANALALRELLSEADT